jgi:hypothetical protein
MCRNTVIISFIYIGRYVFKIYNAILCVRIACALVWFNYIVSFGILFYRFSTITKEMSLSNRHDLLSEAFAHYNGRLQDRLSKFRWRRKMYT